MVKLMRKLSPLMGNLMQVLIKIYKEKSLSNQYVVTSTKSKTKEMHTKSYSITIDIDINIYII